MYKLSKKEETELRLTFYEILVGASLRKLEKDLKKY